MFWMDLDSDESYYGDSDDSDFEECGLENLAKLKSLRENVKFEVTGERLELLRQIHSLIGDWKGPLPDFRDIFQPEQIDILLSDDFQVGNGQKFIRFVARSGYKDSQVREPSSSRRTTAVHRFSRLTWVNEMMPQLFELYDRLDANYVDEDGLSHLHVASMFGCDQVVERFLEHGQDPNCVEREKGETPLHLALRFDCHDVAESLLLHGADINLANNDGMTPLHVNCTRSVDYGLTKILFEIMDEMQRSAEVDARDKEGNTPLYFSLLFMNYGYREVVEVLLSRGADPSLANVDGVTPLHMICSRKGDAYLAKMMFEVGDDRRQPLRVDAPTHKLGWTPLHWALKEDYKEVAELLLRRGADPNLANNEGVRPLHMICDDPVKEHDGSLAEMLFKVCDESKRLVEVDARDNSARTPLELAVKNLRPKAVDTLLKRGADLASFVFLLSKYFEEPNELEYRGKKFKLDLALRALTICEHLEKGGYDPRNETMIVMKFFDRHDLFQKSADLDEFWYEDEEFAKEAKGIMLKDTNRSLSLYDSVRLRPKEAAKLFTDEDCLDFLGKLDHLSIRYQETCSGDLSEKLLGRFFRRWALGPFLEVTSYRLPILCCETILENLMNQDLYRICLTTTSQSDNESEKNATTNVIKRYNPRPARTKKVPKKLQDYVR